MEWAEVNFDKAVWTIPDHKMKMRRPHAVPLSRQALAIIGEIEHDASYSGFLFPSLRALDRPMSDNTINAALRRLGFSKDQMTGHGFRAMAATLLNEIRDINLSYLILAQAMIRSDKPQALFRLGMTDSVADMVSQLSPQQLVRVASRNQLMCAMRFDDELIWGLLTDSHEPGNGVTQTAGRLHASVLMAGHRALAN